MPEHKITPEDLAKKLAEKLFGSTYEQTYFVDINRMICKARAEGYREAIEETKHDRY
jgi:hypothetical protein